VSRTPGQEQLDRIAGRVVQQDLRPSRASQDLIAEMHTRTAKSRHLGLEVIDDEVNTVPAARNRPASVVVRRSL